MSRTALITGITGQDGSYLADFLLEKGYEVHGCHRNSSSTSFQRVQHLQDRVTFHCIDLLDQKSIESLIEKVQPTEFYNLAAQSSVGSSWEQPVLSSDVTGLGVTRALEAIRVVDPTIRFFQASSSEMFGKVSQSPQSETTPFRPRSPYGAAKVYAHWLTVNYRENYNMFSCSGILFNHESPRRGLQFVTRKITNGAVRIKLGMANELRLGNLDARRDWGFAGDFVEAMWGMLQYRSPSDYVLGTGKLHTVRDFVRIAFEQVGLNWEDHVSVDPRFYRPEESNPLIADAAKAREELDWSPRKSFQDIVKDMIDSDLRQLSAEQQATSDTLRESA